MFGATASQILVGVLMRQLQFTGAAAVFLGRGSASELNAICHS